MFSIRYLIFDSPWWLRHLSFWMVFVSFFSLVYGSFEEDYALQFTAQLTDAYVQIPVVYLVLYWLMPNYLYKQRYGVFFAWLVVLVLVFSALAWFNYYFVQGPLIWHSDTSEMELIYVGKILKYTTKVYPVTVVAMVIKWAKYSYREQQKTQALIQDKLRSELDFLRAQVHPHFLFNTLNNLYALTLKQSKQAPAAVLKLSELLHYMLYECNADQVALTKEINILRDYLELEKLRYDDQLSLDLDIDDIKGGIQVPPLILLPFVENAFKHGISDAVDESWIRIRLRHEQGRLHFSVSNSHTKEQAVDDQDYRQGIGLKNIERRLDLIYADSYVLEIDEQPESFLVELTIPI